MAAESKRKAGESDRVVFPKYLNCQVWDFFGVLHRKIAEAAARRALARSAKKGLVYLSAEDFVYGHQEVLPTAAQDFDRWLGETKKTHARRAS